MNIAGNVTFPGLIAGHRKPNLFCKTQGNDWKMVSPSCARACRDETRLKTSVSSLLEPVIDIIANIIISHELGKHVTGNDPPRVRDEYRPFIPSYEGTFVTLNSKPAGLSVWSLLRALIYTLTPPHV